ncbi:TPA: hypothetical protein N0F65_007220 [Lagenidium giganteum]|uniref:Uncharacterized protein n=1 Tax=Lagenidium giganteum TaxID=4803 RepID=A0AAV2Z7W9_9STRA|nr:TPA: hypothetical protein N0F65_007220 [Lagenidium giganteum]
MSAASTASPTAAAIEAKMQLSLDDLIKHRKKEGKEQKRASVKSEKSKPAETKKNKKKNAQVAQQQQQQASKRKALMNKNRGLPVEAKKQQPKALNKNATTAPKKQTGSAMSAKKLKRKKVRTNVVAAANGTGRKVESPRKQQTKSEKKQAKQQQQNNNNKPANTKKQAHEQPRQTQKKKVKQPNLSPKAGAVSQTSAKTREVVFGKGRKLHITIKGSKVDLSRRSAKKAKKSTGIATATKSLLPGKLRMAPAKKPSPQQQQASKVVKRVKSMKLKAKKAKVVIRKQPAVRKL